MQFKQNTYLKNVIKWFNQDKLNINAKKSNFVVFSSSNRIIPGNPSVYVRDTQIQSTFSTMFFGVKLNDHSKFNSHISQLRWKATYTTRIVLTVRPFVLKYCDITTLSFTATQAIAFHHGEICMPLIYQPSNIFKTQHRDYYSAALCLMHHLYTVHMGFCQLGSW